MPPVVKTFDDVGDTIAEAVNKLVANSVKRTLVKIDKAMVKFQSNMFAYLASQSGIINSGEAPTFSGISLPQPQWKPLDPSYLMEKQRRITTLVGGQSFFQRTGYLKRYLATIGNPLTVFGNPTVSWEQPGTRGTSALYYGNSKSGFWAEYFDKNGKPTSNFNPSKVKLGSITVDLFPKVKGALHTGMRMGDYFTGAPKVASRLDNYKGGRNREFMPQFMQWWVVTKGKQALRGALK